MSRMRYGNDKKSQQARSSLLGVDVGLPVQIPCESIMESIADGVFTVDANWNVTFFNRAAEEITGVPRGEAIGRKCWEVFHSSICDGACALDHCIKHDKSLRNNFV